MVLSYPYGGEQFDMTTKTSQKTIGKQAQGHLSFKKD